MSESISPAYRQAIEAARADTFSAFISVVDDEGAARIASDAAAALEAAATTSTGASRAFAGMPYAVKDNIDTVALPTTANTPALIGSTRSDDNPVVARLAAAGALLVGKTNLHELAFGITTGAASVPATRNPHDESRSPGGSSGGSAVAVATGTVPFALATDTGGSATIPAAWCGVYGYRPSMGRWPAGRTVPLSATRDTVGVIAQSLQLIRDVDVVVRDRGADAAAPGVIRIGVPAPDSVFVNPLADDVAEKWRSTLELLGEAPDIELVPVATDALHELDNACGIPIVLYETARDLTAYLAALPVPLSFEEVQQRAAAVDVPGLLAAAWEQREAHEAYAEFMATRERLRATWDALFAEHRIDVLLRPTVPVTAVPVGDELTTHAFGEEVNTFGTGTRNTGPGSTSGQPSVSLPTGIGSAGLPVGVSLDGQRDGDDAMLAIAEVVDRLLAGQR